MFSRVVEGFDLPKKNTVTISPYELLCSHDVDKDRKKKSGSLFRSLLQEHFRKGRLLLLTREFTSSSRSTKPFPLSSMSMNSCSTAAAPEEGRGTKEQGKTVFQLFQEGISRSQLNLKHAR